MAIKVTNTTVIDDGKNFVSITNTSGAYGDLHASPSVTTSNISLSNAIQSCIMTANQTFTMSGGDEGRTTALLLDTGSTPYVPAFPSSIKWVGGEPTWANSRYWQITFLSRGTYSTGSAVGYAGSSPTEAVTLDGTASSPVTLDDLTGLTPFQAGWRFKADGNVYQWSHPNNVGGDGETLYSTTTWNNITPSQTYYIKASNYSGSHNLSTSFSDTLNTWIALNQTREFLVHDTETTSGGGYGYRTNVAKIEISANSSGSPVLATGYYKTAYDGGAQEIKWHYHT